MYRTLCSGRNNTDLVGVTWPRAGAQKSRVGQEQYPRIAGQIAIWASGGSESGSERPPAAPRSIVVRETMASFRSAPEIASAPAASELPIGGSLVQEDALVARSRLRIRGLQYWLQYCRIPKSRIGKCGRTESKCKEGRSSERLVGTTVVARVFVHFERAVATYRVSGVREPEDVREGDRHRREFLDPDRCPRRGRYT
ncbi:hypothetical protein T01_1271 [Trichinella spiralis]|uniref:Uncharacterized protein n=1 Tax=Trichinella spiralis TaxID=6334 RepID=A0A0V1BCQ5_TRISP|nr:hypothetical protein T01_1271 [Trichinella spiralis]